jgi:hypothetical protein
MRPSTIRSRITLERCERIVLAFCAVLGAMALVSFARHVWEAGAGRNEWPGLIVRSEIRTIYAPRGIIDFARAHPPGPRGPARSVVRRRVPELSGQRRGGRPPGGDPTGREPPGLREHEGRALPPGRGRRRIAGLGFNGRRDRSNRGRPDEHGARRGIEVGARARTRPSPRRRPHAPPGSDRRVAGRSRLLSRTGESCSRGLVPDRSAPRPDRIQPER